MDTRKNPFFEFPAPSDRDSDCSSYLLPVFIQTSSKKHSFPKALPAQLSFGLNRAWNNFEMKKKMLMLIVIQEEVASHWASGGLWEDFMNFFQDKNGAYCPHFLLHCQHLSMSFCLFSLSISDNWFLFIQSCGHTKLEIKSI